MDISPGKSLPVFMQKANATDCRRADEYADLLRNVGRIESIRPLGTDEAPPTSAMAGLGELQLHVPMAGLIDVDAERARLGKQQAKTSADLKRAQQKLANENFVKNAPVAVVEQERLRVVEFERDLHQLDEQLAKLAELD